MRSSSPQRILLVRLDRIGDVVLSLPVAQVLRRARPEASIAMLVRAPIDQLLAGHPALDEVLVYDKDGRDGGLAATVRFGLALRRRRFDAALVLHPTQRAHWIVALAGIPRRIGYARKGGWLLTDRLPHRKHEGRQHEAAYALELLRPLGIEPPATVPPPVLTVSADAEARVRARLAGIAPDRPLVALHPSASCPSKRWSPERFAAVADALADRAGAAIVLIGGDADASWAEAVARAMQRSSLNLAGALTLAELAALLARCRVLVSNDSGPVHVAAAVGTPVVAIFGRKQPGLSPRRWGPLGAGHAVLHKDVGCPVCLAHNCRISFLCLGAIGVPDVLDATLTILGTH